MPGKHQHFQDPEVGCCGKYFLFGFNIVFWVLGALFLAIGLWAWGEKGVLSNISALTDLGGLDPVWLFVVVGGVMSVLGFAGCIGALRENTFLLKFLATGILAFVFKDWIRDQLNLFINNNVKAYRDDIDLQNLIDFAQEYWSCCGARGPNDWNLNIYFNCTDLNPSRERCGVPFSCCVRDPAEDVLNTQCGYDIRLKLCSVGQTDRLSGSLPAPHSRKRTHQSVRVNIPAAVSAKGLGESEGREVMGRRAAPPEGGSGGCGCTEPKEKEEGSRAQSPQAAGARRAGPGRASLASGGESRAEGRLR
ncbi:tetraspanin-17 isoform X2 [Dasypus novemcinctus]|uniref:tetraspanin-17 isoform X2 n=1 Tax=Dasypus novemcinctus TaxID=9361 RepID=UPI00265E0EDA|nr:tetraspanin-17 isoform X2 [Dasypus novemcinctus]